MPNHQAKHKAKFRSLHAGFRFNNQTISGPSDRGVVIQVTMRHTEVSVRWKKPGVTALQVLSFDLETTEVIETDGAPTMQIHTKQGLWIMHFPTSEMTPWASPQH